jgi:NO-binding membrane sensor protein with MHYT domain/GGDEF domain-containing protein
MAGSYNWLLVFASYCVAVIAAYTAIYFGTRLFDLSGNARKFWLAAGALCLGTGIWSMHFVGMSAYTMPGHAHMSFSAWLTLASWIPAVLASALALYVITLPTVAWRSIAASAFIMGTGIFAMHYGGMYAMQMHPAIQYDTALVILSGVIVVVASGAALVICRKVRDVPPNYALAVKLAAALVMGAAICGMHYTGMAAANYPSGAVTADTNTLRGDWMGIPTAVAASIFLLLALYMAYRDLREAERVRAAMRERQQAAHQAAFYDRVTGLANRNLLEARVLEKLTVRDTGNTPSPFSLWYLELTDYRELIQRHTDDTVQALMRQIAATLQQALPHTELLVRYSNNSFMFIAQPLVAGARAEVVRQLTRALEHNQVINGKQISYQWGWGFSEYPASGTNSRNLIRAAQRLRNPAKTAEQKLQTA